MAVGDCPTCRKLLEKVSLATTRQLRAVSLLEATVQNDPEDRQIPSLQRLIRSCGKEREDAMSTYKGHLLTHGRALTYAAGGQFAYCG